MTCSNNYHMQESQTVVAEDCPTLFPDSYDIPGVYEDCPPFLEAICYPCPPLVSDSLCQDDSFQEFISSPYSEEEAYYAKNPHEEEQLPYSNWRNWGSEYESCFTFGDCWDDDFSSYGNSGLQGREECFQGEEQRGIYSGHYENEETQFSYYDNSLWSGYESWFDERKIATTMVGMSPDMHTATAWMRWASVKVFSVTGLA
ncbi:unnamed protein product [Dovyalis caffra]|uniref:Uncharacterized protein n=1 Tax=Dovyalis caffra TaxID=77055 RepID=A0AAV1RYD9_9ROSI|nr:unnamed protein product [Dovyalis caffra]